MSFINDVFIPNYYNKLGIRRDTFLEIFKQLENKKEKNYCIIETGAARGGPNDMEGNGSSTYLFDKFVNFYDGFVISFELNKNTAKLVNSSTSKKTTVISKDSIEGINTLMDKTYFLDLLYLDSLDTKFDNDEESANHALNELKSGIFYLKNNSMIFIDDTPININYLPPWVKNDKERGQNPNYINSLKFPCGKGRKILEFIKDKKEFEIIKHEYQVLLKYNVSEVVPKTFHRTWTTKEIDYNIFKPICVESWKKYNNDYTFNLYDDNDNRNFILNYYPWFLKIYDSYEKNIMRVDAVRYFYLLYYGGIYVDLDFECFKSLDKYITKESHFITNYKDWVSNAIMISAPQQIIYKEIIVKALIPNCKNENVLFSTGPGMLSKFLLPKYSTYISSNGLSDKLFYPIKCNQPFNENYDKLDKDTVVCVHHFAGSWVNK
uniref:Glycosyltransferase n=1 Tax=viral metagenome TaxID=1070528 RepID=A0A6C0BRS6_9ZZZZ